MAEVHRLQNAGANKPPELKEPVFSSKSGRVLGRTLGTLDEQLHDMYTPEDESVTQIRSEIKAKRAARKIFINVAKPGSKMGRTPGDEKASKGALKAWVAQNDFPKRMRRGPIEGLYMESLESGKVLEKDNELWFVLCRISSIIEAYSDSSWITNSDDHTSTTGWVFLLGRGVISWDSKKQTCITYSMMESDFVALAAARKEA
ncbi:hypothetical protein Tco_0722985 [Tanacetum coccineum]